MISVLHLENQHVMIKDPIYYVYVTKQGEWSQQLRLIVPHVFNMANGTDLFEKWKLATLNATLTSIPYRCQAITIFSTLAPEVHSQEIGKKNNPLAPRGTSLMNLKERSREFIIVRYT